MTMTYDEALEQLTGEGAPFEIMPAEIDGRSYQVFKNTPPSLRDLWNVARARGEQEYLIYEEERWSFERVMQHVDAIGALLVNRYGLKKGDRVAVAMRNYPEWVCSFAAITSVGGISVSMNAWWTDDEIDYALEDCGAKVLIADRERIDRAAASLGRLGCQGVAVRCEGELPAGVERLEDVLPLGLPLPQVEISPDDDATILYTSGTTGRPKGAVSTHRAVLSAFMSFAARAAVIRACTPEKGDASPYPTTFILIVPLFHVTGCVPVMIGSFAGGSKLVMMYKWDPSRALELIERERVTMFVGVPTQSWDLLECSDFEKYDTSSLASVGGGGAAAPPELVKRIDKSFRAGRPNIGYGMTETNAYGPGNSGPDYVRKPTSTGRALPTMQVRVIDAEGQPLPTGEIGEICFRGPNLIRGYWNKPDATAETIQDGWLRSGDLGSIDEEGFVYVRDRAKDMVLRGGENVYCAEVEAAIYEHSSIHETAVFGLPHERLGEEVGCAIVLKPGADIAIDELRKHVGERLANFKVPSYVRVFGAELPRNAAGKILKRELRDQIAAALER